MNKQELTSYLKFYKDFPTKGVNFVDIIPLIQNKDIFAQTVEELGALITAANIAVPEARGFLFATPLLLQKHISSIIPFRKKGKLPFDGDDLQSIDISKEYGTDKLFFRKSDLYSSEKSNNIIKVCILDDILATGGTAKGIADKLLSLDLECNGEKYKIEITEFVFLGELSFLDGRKLLEDIAPVKSLFKLD